MENFKPHFHPKEKTNILLHLCFLWQLPVLFRGYRKKLSEKDLQCSLKEHQAKVLGDKLEKIWLEEVSNFGTNASFWKVLLKVFGLEFALYGIFLIPVDLMRFLQPWFVWKLLSLYTSEDGYTVKNSAYIYTFLIILTSFVQLIGNHHFWFGMEHLGIKIRVACSTLIYRKCLNLSQEALAEATFGQIINLIATDVAKFNTGFIRYVHSLWILPLFIVGTFWSLYSIFGVTSTVGMLVFLVFAPLQFFLSKTISGKYLKMSQRSDQRIRLLTEIIEGIKVIKMLVWEKPFTKLTEAYRKSEMVQLAASLYLFAINLASLFFLNKVAVCSCVLLHILTGHVLQSTYIFVLQMFYENLRIIGILFCSWGGLFIGEIRPAVKRIEHFLKCTENQNQTKSTSTEIVLNEICFKNILKEISMVVKSPQKIGIIGPVGCGKSTILKVMLEEIPLCHGTIEIGGTLSYASQDSWIFDGTIKDNILLGEHFNEAKYLEVVKVCALERDFFILPQGDLTFVGSKGAMLSGGQKSRINLARAVYKNADFYLLDDPFSSVDIQVGEFILKNCLKTYLKKKAVVLVTHQLEYLDEVDRIYVIEGGRIVTSGSYDDLKHTDYFVSMKLRKRESKNVSEKARNEKIYESVDAVELKENMELGTVQKKVYKNYFKAGGGLSKIVLMLLLYFLQQTVLCGSDYFMTVWVNLEQNHEVVPSNFLYIYLSLVVVLIPLSLSSGFWAIRIYTKATQTIHSKMLQSVLSAPLRFFNSNPSGRILNRFSSDIGQIDRLLPIVITNVVVIGSNAIGFIILIIIVNPWIVIPTLIIIGILACCRKLYLCTSRLLKRFEANSRSPVLSHLTSTLQGLSTIRISGAVDNQKERFEYCQDAHTAANYMFLACESAFGFWLDVCSFIYLVIVIVNVVLINNETHGGYIGLSIMSSIMLTGMVQYGMKEYAELENKMVSVERVLEYTELAPERQEKKLRVEWPTNGVIEFQNVSLRYDVDHFSLKEVTFTINQNEKIGIVGRTGAGKSSLISVLFRLFEFEGYVLIDGTNTKTIPLPILRSKLAIIPQDPVLFSCSIRTNLDPYEEYDDSQLWDVLAEVEMKSVVAALPSGLSHKVTEGGLNFSVGQRQLLCLSRAILKMNKIMIMDEATANVDLKTDEFIRGTIKKKFKNCTVFTIAHRIHTIMDCDKVLVMSDGCVLEFGAPSALLQDTKGEFYKLVNLQDEV